MSAELDPDKLTAFEIGILRHMAENALRGGEEAAHRETLTEAIWPHSRPSHCGEKRHRKCLYAMKGQLARMARLGIVEEIGSDWWRPTPAASRALKRSGCYPSSP